MAASQWFSSGSSSSSRSGSRERDEPPHEFDSKGNTDPERLVQCPYDKNHQIRSCRFPYHLIKCRKNHPKLVNELKTCPFNARHLVPKHQLTHHTKTCEDRVVVDPDDGGLNGQKRWQVPVSTWVNPNTTEDWETETDPHASKFVWGPNNGPRVREDVVPTNGLGPSFRAPNTLPWS